MTCELLTEIGLSLRPSAPSSGFAARCQTLATQLQALIAAIMNPHVTRKRLRQLAEALSSGPIGSAMSAEAGRRLSNKNDATAPMLKALLSTRDPQEVVAPPFSLENGPGDQHCH
jgi:hypothetical protein